MAKSADSLACECGQVLFDVADREPGETLICPWCSKEYRYLGGKKVEPVSKNKSKDKPKDSPLKEGKPKSVRTKAASADDDEKPKAKLKESAKKIVVADDVEVFKFSGSDKETVKMKAPSIRRKVDPEFADGEADSDASQKKKRARFGDAPGGVFPMLGFMAGFSVLAFVVLGTLFPENAHHKRTTPWGDPLSLRSPWPELIAMIVGQVFGFVAWGFYVYRLHLRQKAAAAAAAAEGSSSKSTEKDMASTKRISVRRKSTRETRRDRDDDDDDGDDE